MNNNNKISVGDRVRVIQEHMRPSGMHNLCEGVVVYTHNLDRAQPLAVDFGEESRNRLHSCGARLPQLSGWWYDEHSLEIIPPKKENKR